APPLGSLPQALAHRGPWLPGRGPARRLELHLELALVRRIRIPAVRGAALLTSHALEAGDRSQAYGDPFPDARSLEQRDAGAERGMRDQIVLAEIWQQPGAEDGQQRKAGNPAQQHPDQYRRRARLERRDGAALPALAASQ